MKRAIGMIVLGLGGLLAAIGLTVGALALAGDDVGRVVQPNLESSRSREPSGTPSDAPRDDVQPSLGASPSDDGGGETASDDDPAGSDDNSGPGSSNSGPGSDDSGSGSNSGSGSDSSGPGSGDD